MARIGVITDAHANLPALEAALEAIERVGCHLVVHTGDAIGIGPHPAECLDLLLARPDMRLVMGNHDAWFAFGLPEPRPAWIGDGEYAHHRWTHQQLDPALRDVVARWPYALRLDVGGIDVAFCHYPRTDDGDFASIVRDPAPADLDRLFATDADLCFYGHHHPPSDLRGAARYVNPGALGCHTEPLARFAIHDVDDGRWDVHLRAVPYDRDRVLRDLEERDVPARADIRSFFFDLPD